jgi:hypothetical protein
MNRLTVAEAAPLSKPPALLFGPNSPGQMGVCRYQGGCVRQVYADVGNLTREPAPTYTMT